MEPSRCRFPSTRACSKSEASLSSSRSFFAAVRKSPFTGHRRRKADGTPRVSCHQYLCERSARWWQADRSPMREHGYSMRCHTRAYGLASLMNSWERSWTRKQKRHCLPHRASLRGQHTASFLKGRLEPLMSASPSMPQMSMPSEKSSSSRSSTATGDFLRLTQTTRTPLRRYALRHLPSKHMHPI